MFTPEDILSLTKAGFNAQQIAGLSMLANKQTGNPTVVTAPPTTNVPPVTTAPPVTTTPPVTTAPPVTTTPPVTTATPVTAPENTVDPILAELQKLTGLVQGNNISNTSIPKVQTPEDILAEIINPPIRKE